MHTAWPGFHKFQEQTLVLEWGVMVGGIVIPNLPAVILASWLGVGRCTHTNPSFIIDKWLHPTLGLNVTNLLTAD